MKKIWYLEVKDHKDSFWDSAHGFVVIAEDEFEARILASKQSGDEGSGCWIAQSRSTCTELLASGDSRVVLRDFNAA